MTPKGMCSMLWLAKHYDASLCITIPEKYFSLLSAYHQQVLLQDIIQIKHELPGHHAGHGISCERDEIARVQRHAHCLFFGQKIIFHFPKSWNQATKLNKWLSWSRFWVRKFSMIRRTLHNTWFGTKISRAFSIVCIWPFYLRFVVSNSLMARIFPR